MNIQKINSLSYWSSPKEQVLSVLETSERGLSEHEAADRLKQFGPNELAKEKKKPFLIKFLGKFSNPLILILIFASVVSGLLGELTNFFIITFIIIFSAVIDFYQEYQADNAVEKLRRKVSLTATVLRDDIKKELPLSQIVPGDLIFLSAGGIVPADARLLESRDLMVDQSSLTGESYPQEKQTDIGINDQAPVIARTNSVFMGTHVLMGQGQAIVVRTGQLSEFGHVSQVLVEKRPATEFEKGIHSFGLMIMKITIILVLFIFFVNAVLRGEILNSLLFSLALAIGLAPELLPMILTINLSRGAMRMAKKDVIVKDLPAIQNFGSMEVLCTDKTGTLTEGKISLEAFEDLEQKKNENVLLYGHLNSVNQAGLKTPLEKTLMTQKLATSGFKKVDELPFDFTRKRLSVIYRYQNEHLLITDGAPEGILPLCNFSADQKKKADQRFRTLSSQGLRVLAVASKKVPDKEKYTLSDENDLIFVGFLIFSDPPKKTAYEALQHLEKQGVTLKILTGDNELVTEKVCREIGLPIKGILLGSEISKLSEEEFQEQCLKTTIFARLDPEQKEKIILTLKKSNLVVGFLGDGINDAPSLRAADIGISVNNAVDVAKESADLILLKKDLHVLKDGVDEGRKTHGNVMKYIMMGTSSDFGNMTSLAATSLFLPFLPMLPVQILLNDLLYDMTQLVIPSDNVDSVYINKPKKWDINFIKKFMLVFGPLSSLFDFLTFFLLLLVFKASHQMFQTGWFIESISTQTLIVFAIRTKMVPFYKSRPSVILTAMLFLVVAFAWIIPLTPLGNLFSFTPLPPQFYLIILSIIASYVAIVELAKRWFYRRNEI